MGSSKDAGSESRLLTMSERFVSLFIEKKGRDWTHNAAMSLTPRHFLTSWTIIFIFPPSPVSAESCTDMGGQEGSSSMSFGDKTSVGVLEPSSSDMSLF